MYSTQYCTVGLLAHGECICSSTLWIRHGAIFIAVLGGTLKPEKTTGPYALTARASVGGKPWCRTRPGEPHGVDSKLGLQTFKWNELFYLPLKRGFKSVDIVVEEALVNATGQRNDFGIGHVCIDLRQELDGCEAIEGVRFVRRKFKLCPWRLKDSAALRSRLGTIELAIVSYGDGFASSDLREVIQLKNSGDIDCVNQQTCTVEVRASYVSTGSAQSIVPAHVSGNTTDCRCP